MELRQLTYFVAVAEELHFERAARRLCMTQPPLSQAIKQLEEEMGVGLFERSHRRIRLTRAGEAFLEEARHVICATDHSVERARLADRGEWGRLTVGFVGSATYDMLPWVIRMYRQEYPDIAVETRELSTPMQIEALRQKQIDIGVLRPPVDDFAVQTQTVYRIPSVLALPKYHSFPDGLWDHLLGRPPGCVFRDALTQDVELVLQRGAGVCCPCRVRPRYSPGGHGVPDSDWAGSCRNGRGCCAKICSKSAYRGCCLP